MLDLEPRRDEPTLETPPPDRSVRTAAAVVLGLLAVLVVLSIVSGGGDGGPSTATTTSTSTSTTTPRRTPPRPTPPPAPSGAFPVLAASGPLEPSLDMAVITLTSDGTVAIADLATGREIVHRERVPVAPIQAAWWNGTTFIARTHDGELYRLVPGSPDEWERLEVSGADQAWGGPQELVTLWDPTGPAWQDAGFGVLGARGEVQRYLVPIGVIGPPAGLLDGRLVVSTGDGIYLVEQDGTARRHALGVALGADHGLLVRRTCDEMLTCRLVVDELGSGASVDLGVVEPSRVIRRALPAPGGDAVALLVEIDDEQWLEVHPLRGGPPVGWRIGERWSEPHMLQWAADGSGLAWIDGETWSVRSVPVGGEVPAEPASAGLASLPSASGFIGNFLVPAAALPPGWLPVS